MAEAHAASPYAVGYAPDDNVPVYAMPQMQDYAVPDALDSARDTRQGWDNTESATILRESPTGTPDASRLRHHPLHETRPGEGEPISWWRRFTRDYLGRHGVEYQDADGHETIRGGSGPLVADRPRPGRDVPETRPTMRMNPSTYRFTRPFPHDGIAREFNGSHFSMADHRREYAILGMEAPRKIRRNTYRIEPEPWDTDLVDLPPRADSSPNERVESIDIPPPSNRTWRL